MKKEVFSKATQLNTEIQELKRHIKRVKEFESAITKPILRLQPEEGSWTPEFLRMDIADQHELLYNYISRAEQRLLQIEKEFNTL